MKFWKSLLDGIGAISHWIIKAGAEILEPLKSMNEIIKEKTATTIIANEVPVKTVIQAPIKLIETNHIRKKLIIQNIGIDPCFIKLDNTISKDDFHFVLAPDTSIAYGNGGSVALDGWHGEVWAVAERETQISVLEY